MSVLGFVKLVRVCIGQPMCISVVNTNLTTRCMVTKRVDHIGVNALNLYSILKLMPKK